MKQLRDGLKICFTCSAGGHLSQAMEIAKMLRERHHVYFVTNRLPHFGETILDCSVYFVVDPHLSYPMYLVNMIKALLVFFRQWPDVVISTGAGVTIPTCLLAKLFKAKLIFVESGSRAKNPSRTGRFLYRFADLFVIQWESLQWAYPKAVVGGALI